VELRESATGAGIARLNALVDRRLPGSYLDFLAVTDGLLLNFSYDGVSLGTCDERLAIFGAADYDFVESIASLASGRRFFPFAAIAGESDVYLFDTQRCTTADEFAVVHGSVEASQLWPTAEPLVSSFDEFFERVIGNVEQGDSLGIEPDDVP